MANFVFAALLGLLGSNMGAVAFVAAASVLLGAATVAAMAELSWLGAAGLFYSSLAVAEGAYLGAVCLRYWPGRVRGARRDSLDTRRSRYP